MKRLFLFLLGSASAITSMAQSDPCTWSLIPHVGVSISNSTNDYIQTMNGESSSNSTFRSGFVGGVEVRYQSSDCLAISAGLNYTQAGWAYDDKDLGVDDKGKGTIFHDANYRLNYLDLPLTAHFFVVNGLAVNIGLQPSFMLNGNTKFEFQTYTVDKEGKRTFTENEVLSGDLPKEAFKEFVLSVPLGLSYEYQNVVLDARYVFGLTKVMNFLNGKNRMITLTVGYKFDL
nr:porin family protein [uncultured Prevotella sp.]